MRNERNHLLRKAQQALWDLEGHGIMTMSEVLKMTGPLQAKKEGIV